MSVRTEKQLDQKPLNYYSTARVDIARFLPQRISRCLDVGCGTGATAAWIKETGRVETFGIEISEAAAECAANWMDRVFVGNVETMEIPLARGSIDLILCLDVLEHLVDPWKAVRRLADLLAPGGTMIACLPNVQHISVLLGLMCGRWRYAPSGCCDRTHLRFFVQSSVRELFEQAGLSVDAIGYRIVGKSAVANRLTLDIFKCFFAYQYYIRASKV